MVGVMCDGLCNILLCELLMVGVALVDGWGN